MAVSPLEVPGKILVRGSALSGCRNFEYIVSGLVNSWETIMSVLNITNLSDLQERIIFALQSDLDVFIIGPRNAGKRTACLIPMLAHAIEESLQSYTPEERMSSPTSILICNSTRKGMQVNELLQHFFNSIPSNLRSSTPVAIGFVDNIRNKTMIYTIAQPLDILIMTSSALQVLFRPEFGPKLADLKLNFHRTRYILFEEMAMRSFFLDKEIMQFVNHIRSQPMGVEVNTDLKLIFSGTSWHNENTGGVRNFLRKKERYSVVIFGSSRHALQYSKSIVWKVDHCTTEKARLNYLIGICKSMMIQKRKIVVACSTAEQANKVGTYISENGGICNKVVTLGNHGESLGVFRRNTDWLGKVFVVSDDAWPDFDVTDASCLIHFDIQNGAPNKRWGQEEEPMCPERFACLWNRMEKTWRSIVDPPGLNHFLISGYELNFLAVFRFLQSMDVSMPQTLESKAEQMERKEMLKLPLCENLKCFAYCNTVNCPNRHDFSQEDLDLPPDAPTNGELEFKVLESIHPSLYTVKLLKHYSVNEKTGEKTCAKVYREEEVQRMVKMLKYFSVPKNKIRPLKVAVGQLYGIPYKLHVKNGPTQIRYLRAKIIDFIFEQAEPSCSSGANATPCPADYAEMFCVDSGHTLNVTLNDLLELPEDFRNWKPFCVQAILSNLLFLEDSNEYHSDALEAAKEIAEGKVWNGKVLLSLRNTVWINPMVHYEVDGETGKAKVSLNMSTELITRNHVTYMENHNHLMILQEYIRKQDPCFPEIHHELSSGIKSEDKSFHKKGDIILWAKLPVSTVDPNRPKDMKLSPLQFRAYGCMSPWQIYGAVSEEECVGGGAIKRMEEELTREVERMMKNKGKLVLEWAALLKERAIVAVKANKKSETWRRAMIIKEHPEKEDSFKRFDVVLVDYGHELLGLRELDQVLPIRKMFVEELPFQMVCIQLAHCEPTSGSTWGEPEIDTFHEIMDMQGKPSLTIVALTKVERKDLFCHCYEAIAYRLKPMDENEDDNIPIEEIGCLLIQKKSARVNEKIGRVVPIFENIYKSLSLHRENNRFESVAESQNGHDDEGLEFLPEDVPDNDSEASSSDSFERFQDVTIQNGEYIAVGDPSASLDKDEDKNCSEKPKKQVRFQGIFAKVCDDIPELEVYDEGENSQETEDEDNGNSCELNEEDDVFYDAVDDLLADQCTMFVQFVKEFV